MPQHDEHTERCLAMLEDGIRELAHEPGFIRWLRAQALFHNYSYGNVLLILAQRPDTSQVAGYQTFRRLGLQVRKGSKAIRILAPTTRRQQLEDEQTGEKQTVTRLTGFRTACVFAVEDCDGELPESPAKKLTGDAPEGLYDRVAAYITDELHHSLIIAENGLGGPNAFVNGKAEVHLDGRLSPRQAVKSLLHECGHIVAHHVGDCIPRSQAETEAEAVSYICAQALGLSEAGTYSFPYLAVWNSGTDEAITALRASCQRIADAARTILTALLGTDSAEDAA